MTTTMPSRRNQQQQQQQRGRRAKAAGMTGVGMSLVMLLTASFWTMNQSVKRCVLLFVLPPPELEESVMMASDPTSLIFGSARASAQRPLHSDDDDPQFLSVPDVFGGNQKNRQRTRPKATRTTKRQQRKEKNPRPKRQKKTEKQKDGPVVTAEDVAYVEATVDRIFDLMIAQQRMLRQSKKHKKKKKHYTKRERLQQQRAAFRQELQQRRDQWWQYQQHNQTAASSSCALLFHGLPRAFRNVVLPSLVRNVLIPNALYHCDIFVYYHQRRSEGSGRSGAGGAVQPDAIQLLRAAAHRVAERHQQRLVHKQPPPRVITSHYTDAQFFGARRDFLQRTQTATDASGKSLYVPWRANGFDAAAVENIVRMWHGIQGVWELFQQEKRRDADYQRVGMFRSDVFFASPVDIFQVPPPNGTDYGVDNTAAPLSAWSWDSNNTVAVIPGFAKYPVNDRLMYGPYEALRIYATQRFDLVHQHVLERQGQRPNGMHPETMLNHTIFPKIRRDVPGVSIVEDPTMCFVRARADETVWMNDCKSGRDSLQGRPSTDSLWQHLQETLGRPCQRHEMRVEGVGYVDQADCRQDAVEE